MLVRTEGHFWMLPVYLLYCLITLALQFFGGFKILTKTWGFLATPPLCPCPTTWLGQKTCFPSSNVISLLCRHSRYHTPALANGTANQTTQQQSARRGARYHRIRWMCIENFLKVAVRAQKNWSKVWWLLKCATELSHHGTTSYFPCWKDWNWLWLQIGGFFQTTGRSWMRHLQVLQEGDQKVFHKRKIFCLMEES